MEEYNQYIGKKYNYLNKNIEIRNIKKVNGNVVVSTDGRTFAFYENEINNFFKELKPQKMEDKNIKLRQVEPETVDIKAILFDAIKQVKKDKSYVAQANCICNITSQLINIKKLELNK